MTDGTIETVRGFILQASYRLVRRKPVVHLYGVTDHGKTFLVRDYRQRPHFHVRRSDAGLAYTLGATCQRETANRTFDGVRTIRIDVPSPQDAPPVRDRLQEHGVETFEADVRFAVRYLIDRQIQGGCEIVAATTMPSKGMCLDYVFDDPLVRPADVTVKPTVLSFDIETDPKANRLLAIAIYGCGVDEVLIVEPKGRPMPNRARGYATEKATIDAFSARVLELDPDVLTGWNVVDFDLNVLSRIARRTGATMQIGRDIGNVRIRPARGYFGSGQATIPGRLVLDGMDLLRGAFQRFEDYSLNTVASEVLGEGKVALRDSASATGAGKTNRADDIMARYRNDLATFADYARTDARLALEIVEKVNVIPLAIERSRLTGMTPDRVAASIASFDFLYLSALRRRRLVAPSVRSSDAQVSKRQAGGHVFEPVTGLHENVWVFDFKSLYPSVIRTFNIDPLGFLAPSLEPTARDAGSGPIRVTDDAHFSKGPAILPAILDELFPRREAAKQAGDGVASQAIKILMNSFYGVLGTPACRFHNVAIANAITGMGRQLLLWSRDWFQAKGFDVLYGDTDSVFVRSGLSSRAARGLGPKLASEINGALGDYVAAEWQVTSKLEMEFEKLYVKLFLPSVRHGGAGARKRYAGQVDGATDVDFTGMEVVRRDWTELAKDVQRGLYRRLFAGEPVSDYLASVTASLRSGELDHKLVYRKALRKRPADYTANTPPHVVAWRKSNVGDRLVSYVMTVDGPEPLDALVNAPDREHYVSKQVRPVAEPVLGELGLDFARVIGDERQQTLF